jgi:2-dehydropantoate 2-reductase
MERVLVLGVGGIGGTIAGRLAAAAAPGRTVHACTRNGEIADALAVHGARLRGVRGASAVPGLAVVRQPADLPGPADLVVLATQPPDAEAAAASVVPVLGPAGVLLVCPNGLLEERLEAVVGPERVVGCVVSFGASHPEPGVFEQTSRGGLTLGRLPGRPAAGPSLDALAAALAPVGPVVISDNLLGVRWAKLGFNSAVSTLGTIGGERVGPLLARAVVRRLAVAILRESLVVAEASGVTLAPLPGSADLRWFRAGGWFADARQRALVAAFGARYRRMRSSMLAAIERGRPPAVDFLNGEVAARAAALGVPAPVNAAATAAVHRIAAGAERPGPAAIDALAAAVGLG